MKKFSALYIALILAFLFAPIAVLIVFSFNSGDGVFVFEGFSFDFRWYKELFKNEQILDALKNSLIPVITYFGPMLAYIVTGSIVVEKVFAVPGIGRDFVNSIINRDYPLVMGTTIVLASLIVIMNLIGDIMYKVVDPRINLE